MRGVSVRIRVVAVSAIGFCLLTVPLLRVFWPWSPEAQFLLTGQRVWSEEERSPWAKALSQARWHRMLAQQAVKREREARLEPLSLEAAEAMDTDEWRRLLAARDRSGDLQRARAAARRALELARNRTEEYQARYCLVQIECDAGHHRAELQQARRLIELDPRDERSLTWLRHAQRCSRGAAIGLEPQAVGNRS